MNAVEFVKKYGWEESQYISSLIMETGENVYGVEREDLHRLVESYELVESVGGMEIAKKITFQKRLRNDKATHFIQHSENQKLIQLISRNQKKPESSIEFKKFEQAIAYVEKCQ